MENNKSRKIIHIDMDCFYAAIEMRDNPALVDKPIAVGGSPTERGVLCTCNYVARKFGVRSAMATAYALKICPDLIVLPVSMNKYRAVAAIIHSIFREYTTLVEPLSLDEAYLDVTHSNKYNGSATLIAEEIRKEILHTVHLTASAGVAPNKFLAKIASGWKKPNGLFVIPPNEVSSFIQDLPVKKIFGVGKVTETKLKNFGLHTCSDIQKWSLADLMQQFGKLGLQLFYQSHGIDNRPVEPNKTRKSLSVERTFKNDIFVDTNLTTILHKLYDELLYRLQKSAPNLPIKNQYIKIKYSNFKLVSLERSSNEANYKQYEQLLFELAKKQNKQIRLLGIGVHFNENNKIECVQQNLF